MNISDNMNTKSPLKTYRDLAGREILVNHLRPAYFGKYMIGPIASPLPFRDHATDAQDNGQSNIWLISFTDLMALMLTFFVLVFSMSVPDEQSWPDLTGTLSKEFSKFEGPRDFESGPEVIRLPRITHDRALSLDYLNALLSGKLKRNQYLRDVEILRQPDRLLLSLPNDLLFLSGQATISEKGQQAINALVPALNRIDNELEISGHADPRPVGQGAEYVSNWHLSFLRAHAVASEMENKGYQKPLAIHAYSSARFGELPDNVNSERKLDLARRVDIVIYSSTGQVQRNLRFEND